MENNRQTHEKYGHEFPPFKKITIVDGLGSSQILFIGRDPIPSLIHSFFSRKLTIYNDQHVCRKYKPIRKIKKIITMDKCHHKCEK